MIPILYKRSANVLNYLMHTVALVTSYTASMTSDVLVCNTVIFPLQLENTKCIIILYFFLLNLKVSLLVYINFFFTFSKSLEECHVEN